MLKRIYEPAAYAASSLSGCYWPTTCEDARGYPALDGAARAEIAVIGAGFTGLSAALHLAGRGVDVAVLDLHQPGWGASGRNGGFCCIGGAKLSRKTLLRRYGVEGLIAYRNAERSAVASVDDLITNNGLRVDRHSGGGEVVLAHRPGEMAALHHGLPGLRADYDVEPEMLQISDLHRLGMCAAGTYGGLRLPLGFGLNPRKYVLGLAHLALDRGARIHGNSPVQQITRDADEYVLTTPGGVLRAKKLILATNGYSSENLPPWMRARYLPVQSSILVTRPLEDAEIAAQGWSSDLMAYDTRNLLHYFRLMPDRRFLFGMRGGIGWTKASHARVHAAIHRDFSTMFPAWAGVETPFFWSGLANLSRDLHPFVGAIDGWPGALAAFAYHGNGVAMGSWCGEQVARLAMGDATALPGFFQTTPTRFEPGRWRRASLRLAYGWYQLRDAI